MKNIKQWLNSLPEPFRSEALQNYQQQNNADGIKLEDQFPDKKRNNFLSAAFVWSETKQGFEYWRSLEFEIEKGKIQFTD